MANPNMLTRIGAPLVLAGSLLAMNACGNDETTLNTPSGNAETVATVELNTEQQQQIGELCVNGFNMSTSLNKEFALDNVGGADSLMNRFTTKNDKGENVPVNPETFADLLLDEVCKKPEVLATITAYMTEPAGLFNGKASTIDASSLQRVKELSALYRSNEVEAMNAIRTIASVVKAPRGAQLVDDFAVIENAASRIVPTREGGNVTGLNSEMITVGDLYTGFLFNYGREGLTEKQAADRETVKMLVLIGKDGEFVIKVWIGDQNIDLNFDENATETTLVNPTENTTADSIPTNSTTVTGTTPNTTTGTTPNTTPGTTPNTTTGTTPNTIPGTTPNTTPGTTPGTTPNTTPGTTPGTTPNTEPPVTEPPTTTTPNTAPPTTATTVPKGPAPSTSLPGDF